LISKIEYRKMRRFEPEAGEALPHHVIAVSDVDRLAALLPLSRRSASRGNRQASDLRKSFYMTPACAHLTDVGCSPLNGFGSPHDGGGVEFSAVSLGLWCLLRFPAARLPPLMVGRRPTTVAIPGHDAL